MQRGRRRRGFTIVEILLVCIIVALLAAILGPRFWRIWNRANFTACGQNLKSIATSLETYATGQGETKQYPASLRALNPVYLDVIPTCPAASVDTYAATYQKTDDPAAFTVYCGGAHHAAAGEPPDRPMYQSGVGLK